MRGKVAPVGPGSAVGGITPACAGKSPQRAHCSPVPWDHPCVCGEKIEMPYELLLKEGSPPRMRGKGSRQLHSSAAVRITPARAGKSQARKAAAAVRRDHPRVCGEKPFEFNNYAKFLGSPPRMRGKAPSRYAVFPQHGITPAYAGKRPPAARWNSLAEDHPRVCGEKCGYRLPFRSIVGSPPRVRGKDDGVIFKRHFERITPACAGKS